MNGARQHRTVRLAALALATLAARPSLAQQAAPAPPPEVHSVATKDGVQIGITYYPSTAGQQAVPVVCLHDFNETQAVFEPLARRLQKPPRPEPGAAPTGPPEVARAVVTVDLRGHGQSKTAFSPDGDAYELDANRFGLGDFQNMVQFDMEAVRRFLVERNDAGQLNLNKLCVVGAGMGANVAVLWAEGDWRMPPLPARKQGQDVKALVLLSPRWNYRGLALVEAMKYPPMQQELSVLLAYGANDRKVAKDGENLYKIFSRHHPTPPPEQILQQDFFYVTPKTELQGTALLKPNFELVPKITQFIQLRLGLIEFPYVPRKK